MKLLNKIVGAALGLTMAVGVGLGIIGSHQEPVAVHATADVTYRFSDHYSANTVVDGTAISLDSYTTVTFNKRSGGTATQYYTNGSALRWYGGGTAVFSSSKTLIGIEITFTQTANSVSADVGSYASGVWSGEASAVTLTQSGTTGHCRISTIALTYKGSEPVHTHDFGEWVTTTEPTCTEPGEQTRTCECGATETQSIPATGHHYEDGICTVCGAEEPVYFIIVPSDGEAATATDFSFTKLPMTISATASTLGEEIRVFKGQSITISGVTMKKIVFTCTANGTTKYGPGCWGTGAPSGYTFEASGKTGTWEGKLDTITFTATDNQVRIIEIDIYIDAEGFVDLFMDNLVCNAAGTSAPTFTTGYSWAGLKSIYRTLDLTEKGRFTTPDATTTDMIARYDYIVGKYDYEDFIGRHPAPIGRAQVLNILPETAATSSIVIIISLIGITAIAGYVLIRKRKELN